MQLTNIKIIKDKWGINFPIIFSFIVLVFLSLSLVIVLPSQNSVINSYIEETPVRNDLELVYQLEGGMEPWTKDTNTILDYLNRTSIVISNNLNYILGFTSIITTNNIEAIYNFYWVSQNLWDQLLINDTTKIVLSGQIVNPQMSNNSIQIIEYNMELNISETNTESLNYRPEFLTSSEYGGSGLFLPEKNFIIQRYNQNLNSTKGNWGFKLETQFNNQRIESFRSFNQIYNTITDLERDITHLFTSSVKGLFSILHIMDNLHREYSNQFLVFDVASRVLIPLILIIQFVYLKFLHSNIKNIKDHIILLYNRGFSMRNLKLNFVITRVFYPLLPFIVIIMAIISQSMTLGQGSGALIQIILPWILIQLFGSLYLIERHFRLVSVNQASSVDDEIDLQIIIIIFLGNALLFATLFLSRYYQANEINTLDDLFHKYKAYESLSISIIFFIFTVVICYFERIITKKDNQSKLNRIVLKKHLSMLLITYLFLILAVFTISRAIVAEEVSSIDQIYIEADYEVTFTSDPSLDLSQTSNIQNIQNLLPHYKVDVDIANEMYTLTTNQQTSGLQIHIFEEIAFNKMISCDCQNDLSLSETNLFFTNPLLEFMFKSSDTVRLTPEGYAQVEVRGGDNINIWPINAGQILHSSKHAIITSTRYFTATWGNLTLNSLDRVYLGFTDSTQIDNDEVNRRIKNAFDSSSNNIVVNEHSYYNINQKWIGKISSISTMSFIHMMIFTTLFIYISIRSTSQNRDEFAIVLERYGKIDIVKDYIKKFKISLYIFYLTSIIIGFLYTIFSNLKSELIYIKNIGLISLIFNPKMILLVTGFGIFHILTIQFSLKRHLNKYMLK